MKKSEIVFRKYFNVEITRLNMLYFEYVICIIVYTFYIIYKYFFNWILFAVKKNHYERMYSMVN